MKRDRTWGIALTVLVDPRGSVTRAIAAPEPWRLLAVMALGWLMLGLGTLPRQLGLLERALSVDGTGPLPSHLSALAAGLTRLMVVDRIVPLPTVLVAALLVYLAAEPVLMLATSRRRELLVVVVLGLAPLVVLRLGELATSWLADVDAMRISPGQVVRLPHRFATGALLLWREARPPPSALETLEARVNLFSVWSVGLWAYGLSRLDAGGGCLWHVILPAVCLAAGGLVTWAIGPVVLAGVLALGG